MSGSAKLPISFLEDESGRTEKVGDGKRKEENERRERK